MSQLLEINNNLLLVVESPWKFPSPEGAFREASFFPWQCPGKPLEHCPKISWGWWKTWIPILDYAPNTKQTITYYNHYSMLFANKG